MGKNWKTNLGAALSGLGASVGAIYPEYAKIGALITALGTCWGLLNARDYNVSSEQSGVKAPETKVFTTGAN